MTLDAHYTAMNPEPCAVVMDRVNNPGDLSAARAYYVAKALEYLMRAGRKDGVPGTVDIEKARACLTFALEGEWR